MAVATDDPAPRDVGAAVVVAPILPGEEEEPCGKEEGRGTDTEDVHPVGDLEGSTPREVEEDGKDGKEEVPVASSRAWDPCYCLVSTCWRCST